MCLVLSAALKGGVTKTALEFGCHTHSISTGPCKAAWRSEFPDENSRMAGLVGVVYPERERKKFWAPGSASFA
jgi:hypothetical protein